MRRYRGFGRGGGDGDGEGEISSDMSSVSWYSDVLASLEAAPIIGDSLAMSSSSVDATESS